MGAAASREASGIALKHCTLWKADRSPCCRAVMMALDAMNLSVNEVDVNMDKGEHKSQELTHMNRLQTLPILQDKELVLCDSHAISTYLITRYCDCGRLLPQAPGDRSHIEQFLHYNSSVLYPRYKAAAYPILYDGCKHVMSHHVADIEGAYFELETMLGGRNWFSNCPWPMLSDISICATVSTLNVMVPIDKTRFPKLSSWLKNMSNEMFYVTANQKGLSEFSRRIDCGQLSGDDVKEFNCCPKTSECRRCSMQQKEQQDQPQEQAQQASK